MKLVIDAYGGDNAPAAVIEGVCRALREWAISKSYSPAMRRASAKSLKSAPKPIGAGS